MCNEASASNATRIIQGVQYQICTGCDKPISGTGKSLGGIAVWVVKSYVRDSQIVDFPGQWRTLAESCGLTTLHEHHALLVEDHGTQGGLFGADTTHTTHRKSFFRRLHEKRRPDLAINHETIYCMQKPLDTVPGTLELCCSSPPYVHSVHDGNGIDQTKLTGNRPGRHTQAKAEGYGHTEGQLGAMPAGTSPQAAATEEA